MNHGSLFSGIGGFDLAAEWVEWLMGYPIGWTDLRDSEMQSFRK